MKVSAHGIGIDVIDGWEARLFRRPLSVGGGDTRGVLHLANFPLPEVRGDFGAGVVEHLRDGDVFIVVFDYGVEAGDQPLFAREGVPALRAGHFHAANLQRTIPGQVGAQHFFRSGGRGMSVYVVAGTAVTARRLIGETNRVLANLTISAEPQGIGSTG
jgi:hypothetical protein